jgi:hypothetical protein
MLAADTTYLTEDGRPLPRENCPDLQALRSGQAVRDRVVGIVRTTTAPRWFLFNALPLPAGPALGANPRHARIVTTFTEIGSPTA